MAKEPKTTPDEAKTEPPQNELTQFTPTAPAPYGTDNPAPGAAGYEAPVLSPAPGTAEYALAHPGELTSGMLTRADAMALPVEQKNESAA